MFPKLMKWFVLLLTPHSPIGFPGENFNKKPKSAKKGQNDYLKARKKSNFVVVLLYFLPQKTPRLQEYH